MRLTYKLRNVNKLHDELIAAGIHPDLVESLGDDVWLTVADDVDVGAIDAVVAAHDPTPREMPPSIEERVFALESEVTEQKAAVAEIRISRIEAIKPLE